MAIKRRMVAMIGYSDRIAGALRLGLWMHRRIPMLGTALSIVIDKLVFLFYTVDGSSRRIDVKDLRIPHPGGVLLGGNGIVSRGRVLVNAGVKFVGPIPDDPDYLAAHARGEVFTLGDNVVLGANAVLIGPLTICDNVLIGAMSLVNSDIAEPGVYVGTPARKISNVARDVWF